MRALIEKYQSYLMGLCVSLLIFSAVLFAMGFSPITSLQAIVYGSFGSVFSASETFVRVPPLLTTALAFLIGFQARFFNFGAEGQLYIGGLTAYLAASQLGGLPGAVSIPVIALVSFMSGAGWLAIPLLMRIKLEINEIFSTVLMTFIAIFIISWLTTGPIRDPMAITPQTVATPSATWLPTIIPGTRLHVGVVFAFLLAFLIFLILYKTVLGYDIRATGLSPRAARHGGINLPRTIASVGILSGGMAGLAGMVEVVGTYRVLIQGFSPGFGYHGIAVAAFGGFHPIGAILASIFFSILQIGGETMQRGAGVPVEMIYVLQATLVLTVLIFQRWFTFRRRRT